jgi:hypothetical protein
VPSRFNDLSDFENEQARETELLPAFIWFRTRRNGEALKKEKEMLPHKAKYGKIINDYLGIKDKAISKKLDIAKIMSDVLHYNGNVQQALDEGANIKNMDFNFDDIKKMVDESYSDKEKTKTIQLDKK